MPGNTYRPNSPYPAPLGARIAQADHLARALGSLCAKASKSDPGFVWLVGRADEVRTLVEEIVREWSAGSLETTYACEAIGSYVGALHVALHRRYGGYGASCCGPHLEPFDAPIIRGSSRAMRPPLESGMQAVPFPVESSTDVSPSSRTLPTGARQAHAPVAPGRRRKVG
jgi:hypothetical protein